MIQKKTSLSVFFFCEVFFMYKFIFKLLKKPFLTQNSSIVLFFYFYIYIICHCSDNKIYLDNTICIIFNPL